MTLRLRGSTSGYAEINAPAVAGDNSLTLPTTTGTIRITNPSGVDGDYTVATGATISGFTNTITGSTNGSERLRITSDGNVGIGATSPRGLLHVGPDLASGSTDAARINLKQNGLAATDGIYLERSGERRGYYMFVGAPNDGLTFRSNNFGTFTTTMYLDRNGNVGIGTDTIGNIGNRSQLVIGGSDGGLLDFNVGSDTEARMFATDGTGLTIRAYQSDGEIVFQTGGSTEQARITADGLKLASGNGINFNAYATSGNPSSNLLDDYEEGTWTPKVTFGGVDATHVTQNGSYVKIGRLVVCYGMISLSARGTGAMAVEDLPFQVADLLSGTSLEGGGIFSYQNNVSGVYGPIIILPSQNSFVATVYAATSTSGNMAGVTNNNISSNFDCRFTFSYQTAT